MVACKNIREVIQMRELRGKEVALRDGRLLYRQQKNYDYLMSLENRYLIRNYQTEAGRYTSREIETDAFGGWEAPNCQLRGHFLGHYLSAASFYYYQTGNEEIKAKAEALIDELERCQQDNCDGWAASIPEKYLFFIAAGKPVWAPHYTIHKTFMGLLDSYLYMGSAKALSIADRFADWFYDWSGQYSREEFDNILDFETGGMLEVWAQLLEITGKNKYSKLLSRYYRGRLFEPLLKGEDALTNMHANTTIPEILGCARAYEVTGEQKWLDIVKAYWKCAVTDRGYYATGGQTQGEIWTPQKKLKARLGDKNQEHCTVYNMMRLADFLFLNTKDPAYLAYRELNLYNGIMAQSYYENVQTESHKKTEGLLTYFLPMKAGSHKNWAGRTDAFFCCHGTMVQANARLNEGIFYQDDDRVYIGQYIDSDAELDGLKLILRQDQLNGLLQTTSENNAKQTVNGVTAAFANMPDFRKYVLTVEISDGRTRDFALMARIPEWIKTEASIYVNDDLFCTTSDTSSFVEIRRTWKTGDRVTVILPIGLSFVTLPDDPDTGAFRYGPEVLVGLTESERVLKANGDPTEELEPESERQWGEWRVCFKTRHMDPGISFIRINEVGEEKYQMYFTVTNS